MLAKNKRLKKNKDFDSVFKEGKSAYGGFLGVKIKKNDLEISRFGLLLGIKVSKLAVIRNLYKRRIKAVLQQTVSNTKNGYDLVIIVLPTIKNKTYQEIETEIKNLFIKLKFYK